MQRRLPIRADAAGLLRLGPGPTVAEVRQVLEPQLRHWSWSPELATHALKTLATLGCSISWLWGAFKSGRELPKVRKSHFAKTSLQTLKVMRSSEYEAGALGGHVGAMFGGETSHGALQRRPQRLRPHEDLGYALGSIGLQAICLNFCSGSGRSLSKCWSSCSSPRRCPTTTPAWRP